MDVKDIYVMKSGCELFFGAELSWEEKRIENDGKRKSFRVFVVVSFFHFSLLSRIKYGVKMWNKKKTLRGLCGEDVVVHQEATADDDDVAEKCTSSVVVVKTAPPSF